MTRINTIDVPWLTDQHLLVEYREITRISNVARPLTPAEEAEITSYRLGAGHMKFFYDKGIFLYERCEDLYRECVARGFNVQRKIYTLHDEGLNNDWHPTAEDHAISRTRLEEKLHMRPGWYKWWGKPVASDFYQAEIQLYQQINLIGEDE